MSISTNQINDYVKPAAGRPATDYEIKQFSVASPQTLANLKDYYSKLNKDVSITDYLKFNGIDPETRDSLAQQYGITNVGTAEGNTALLQALKGGAPVTTPVGGSITTPQPGSPVDPNTPISGSTTGATVGSVQNPDSGVGGSVAGAAGTDKNQPPKVEGIDKALSSYQSIQSQIGDIDNSLASMLQNKKDEIARSGGVVDESQLKSTILQEQAPLLAHRRELATQQAQAGKMYTDLLARQKESDANFYKQQSIDVTKEKNTATQALAEKKMTIQQQQFEDKLIQSGYKKVADYSDGSKVGEHFINLNGLAVNVDPQTGSETPIGTGAQPGSPQSNISGNAKQISSGKVTYTDFATTPDAPTPENINTQYPGTLGKTYGAIYEDAVSYAETGKYQKVGMSSKPSTKAYDNAVKSKAANIASSLGMTEDQLRAVYAGNKTAVAGLIKSKANISAFESKAKAQIDIILNGYIDPRTGEKVPSLSTSVSRTDYPFVNGLLVAGKQVTGDTNAQLLANSLITFTNEYAKIMTSATGSVSAATDSARKDAEGLVSKALSIGTLEATLGLMQKEMDTTIAGYDETYKATMGNFVQGPAASKSNIQTLNVGGQDYTIGQIYTNSKGQSAKLNADGSWTPIK